MYIKSDNVGIALIHDRRHVGFQIVMQISHVLFWGGGGGGGQILE